MKILVQYLIIAFGIAYASFCMGQSNTYYLDRYGNILDENAYKIKKAEAENSIRTENEGKLYLIENMIELYVRNDSIVNLYNWILTENINKTEKEFKNTNALIGTIYPIKDAKTLNGNIVNIEDFKGKPTLINLWFTTCPPCIREMPVLNKMKDENNDRFNFLSVTMDSKSKVNRLLEKHDFNFDHIVGSEKLTSKLGFRHYPYNIFLDKEGRIKVIDGGVPVKYENGISAPCPDRFLKILESLL